MKAKIQKTSRDFNIEYFAKRDKKKNALAVSSNQSNKIDSYENVHVNYEKSLHEDNLEKCPEYWGGYSFVPYYFEFWEGHESRLKKGLQKLKIRMGFLHFTTLKYLRNLLISIKFNPHMTIYTPLFNKSC